MIWLVVSTLGSVYVLLLVFLYVAQRYLIFPAGRDVFQTPADAGLSYEDLTFQVGGETTCAWFIPAKNPRGTLLFCHGNAGNLAHRVQLIELWRTLGMDVLIYDYGGYGNSTGKPSEQRCYEDGRAMWNYLTETRGVTPERIVLYGRSLGGGVASQLATEYQAGALVLESTFRSAVQMAHETYPYMPTGIMLKHRFDNEARMPNIETPLLMLHSPDDKLIPITHGRALYEVANQPKRFVELIGGHNDDIGQFTTSVIKEIGDFLAQILPKDATQP